MPRTLGQQPERVEAPDDGGMSPGGKAALIAACGTRDRAGRRSGGDRLGRRWGRRDHVLVDHNREDIVDDHDDDLHGATNRSRNLNQSRNQSRNQSPNRSRSQILRARSRQQRRRRLKQRRRNQSLAAARRRSAATPAHSPRSPEQTRTRRFSERTGSRAPVRVERVRRKWTFVRVSGSVPANGRPDVCTSSPLRRLRSRRAEPMGWPRTALVQMHSLRKNTAWATALAAAFVLLLSTLAPGAASAAKTKTFHPVNHIPKTLVFAPRNVDPNSVRSATVKLRRRNGIKRRRVSVRKVRRAAATGAKVRVRSGAKRGKLRVRVVQVETPPPTEPPVEEPPVEEPPVGSLRSKNPRR